MKQEGHHEARAEGHHEGAASSGVAQGPDDKGCLSCQLSLDEAERCPGCQLKQAYCKRKTDAQNKYITAHNDFQDTYQAMRDALEHKRTKCTEARCELDRVDKDYLDLVRRRVQDELHAGKHRVQVKAETNKQTKKQHVTGKQTMGNKQRNEQTNNT